MSASHSPPRLLPLRRPVSPPPRLADYPLVSTEKLRFADTDRNGHVSSAVFAVCCQNARMELLTDASKLPLAAAQDFVVGRLELDFRHEMHWPGLVSIGTSVLGVGRSSIVIAQALFAGERCVALARSTVVLIATSTRRPAPISEPLRLALERWQMKVASASTMVSA